MSTALLAEEIRGEALRLGFEKCAMVPIASLVGFGPEVERRLGKIPEDGFKEKDKAFLSRFSRFDRLAELFPWAKSAVITIGNYGVYKIPENLQNRVAKSFCVDSRLDPRSQEFQACVEFEAFLTSRGLRAETERKYGHLPMRWAANRAGLGRGRKNNFFYTESGSWVRIEAWLVDIELELRETTNLKPCPADCQICQKACPTGALADAYLTRPSLCIPFLNASRPTDWVGHPLSGKAGEWIYGCELCQNACPFNKGKWKEEREFPGLAELSRHMGLETIVGLPYDFIRENLVPKFWYIAGDRPWQWKANALNAMKNAWGPAEREPYARMALNDESPEVRRMAEWVLGLGDRKA
jgi:epoxyqueuosine reductase